MTKFESKRRIPSYFYNDPSVLLGTNWYISSRCDSTEFILMEIRVKNNVDYEYDFIFKICKMFSSESNFLFHNIPTITYTKRQAKSVCKI